jgi:hypothetical protein
VQVTLGPAAAQEHLALAVLEACLEAAALQAAQQVHLAPLGLDLPQQLAVHRCLVLQAALLAAAAARPAAAVLRLAAPTQQML